ncbi:MAG: hypothetical protein DRI56_11140 [Chloroflexota bacterium]|nr:MAG: hypothetical protein DRI56_11140 [Chloroflexota bacterium]
MHEVKPGIYYTDNYPGITVGAISLPHGIIFIDTPLHPEAGYTWKSNFLDDNKDFNYKLLVYLDAHPDRTIGVKAFKDYPIIAHKKTAASIRERPVIFRGELPKSGSEWEKHSETSGLRWIIPQMTFTKKIAFHWGGAATLLEHHPGPRPGASWVIVPNHKVAFVGDAVLHNNPPFLAHADIPQWLETLNILRGPDFEGFTIISSRGGPVSPAIINEQYKNLEYLLKRTEKLAKKNAPPEAVSDLASAVLNNFTTITGDDDFYLQRLRYGLYQYYMKHYVSKT